MVNEIWKQEFHSDLWGVQYHKPQHFVICQWQKNEEIHLCYFFYRWILAAVFLIIMICSICDVGRNDDYGVKYIKWGIYLTNWGVTICTLQAILGASLVTHQFLEQRKLVKYLPVKKRLPLGYQLYWVSHTVAVDVALGITICYWAAVYNPEDHRLDALNILVHACNTIFMLIDFLLVAHPFRLLHFYWPFVFTGCYILFNFTFYELGGTDRQGREYIYTLLDWQRTQKALLATVFGLIFIITLHGVVWMLFLWRKWLANVCIKKISLDVNVETVETCQHKLNSIPMEVL